MRMVLLLLRVLWYSSLPVINETRSHFATYRFMVVRVYSVISDTRSYFATYSFMVVRVYSVITETRSHFATYSFMVDCVNCTSLSSVTFCLRQFYDGGLSVCSIRLVLV